MLSQDNRTTLLDIVETIALPISPLPLTAEERATLDRSGEDYKAGRVLDEDEYADSMNAFMARLKVKSQLAS